MAESRIARFRATRRVGLRNGAVFGALAFAASLAVSGYSTSAQADADTATLEARREFDLANIAFEARRYSEAATRFDASVALKPNALTLFIAAVSWDEAKQSDRAADDYARAVSVEGLDAKRMTTAKTRLAELEQTLGTIIVTAPKGVRVGIDAPRTVPTPARLHATPGRHTLSAVGPGSAQQTRSLTVAAGVVRSIALSEDDVDSDDGAIAENGNIAANGGNSGSSSHGMATTRLVGLTGMAVGAVTIGAAIVLGLRVLTDRDAYYAAPSRELLDETRTFQSATTVCWITGGALVTVGAVVAFLPDLVHTSSPSSSVGLTFTNRGPALRGSF